MERPRLGRRTLYRILPVCESTLMWEKLTVKPATIFLLDGIGALVTAGLLLLILTRFEPLFGMPRNALRGLALMAFVYGVYSFTCYLARNRWRPYLQIIALANLTYCLITLGLILVNYRQVTWVGVAYFVGETILILSLAALEWRLATETL